MTYHSCAPGVGVRRLGLLHRVAVLAAALVCVVGGLIAAAPPGQARSDTPSWVAT